ncbi:MAG: uracil phosphoribosyltransferase [Vampirovibrionia bacterium]
MIRLDEINVTNDITVCENALAKHNLSVLRDKDTPSEVFRMATRRLARLILTEAVKDLPLKTVTIETPLVKTESQILSPDYEIIVAPILRAALTFSEVLQDLVPTAKVYHIGLYRDEETLQPVTYYNKIPQNIKDPNKVIVFVLDPMFATGGSAIEAVKIFRGLNIPEENISFVSLIAAPEGVKKFRESYKNVKLVTGCVDKQLNDKGYILPGLGDAGDRTFNTY